MKAINQTAKKTMDKLTDGLNELGDHRKVDNSKGAFMAVCVEYVDDCNYGPIFSVAHYYEQNGDLMRDPEMCFIRAKDGNYYPSYYRMDGFPGTERETVLFDGNGNVQSFYPKRQKEDAVFAGTWMRNIKQQQRL